MQQLSSQTGLPGTLAQAGDFMDGIQLEKCGVSWDSDAWRRMRDHFLREAFLGDEAAVECFVRISQVAETWDDLVDRDKTISDSTLSMTFCSVLFELDFNKFYDRWRAQITSGIIIAVNGWMDSLELEKGNLEARRKAYVLRNLGLELVPLFAYLLGGFAHMRQVSLKARSFFSHETFEIWENEHAGRR